MIFYPLVTVIKSPAILELLLTWTECGLPLGVPAIGSMLHFCEVRLLLTSNGCHLPPSKAYLISLQGNILQYALSSPVSGGIYMSYIKGSLATEVFIFAFS